MTRVPALRIAGWFLPLGATSVVGFRLLAVDCDGV